MTVDGLKGRRLPRGRARHGSGRSHAGGSLLGGCLRHNLHGGLQAGVGGGGGQLGGEGGQGGDGGGDGGLDGHLGGQVDLGHGLGGRALVHDQLLLAQLQSCGHKLKYRDVRETSQSSH